MNTVTCSNEHFSPVYQLTVALTNLTQSQELSPILQKFSNSIGYEANFVEICQIFDFLNQNYVNILQNEDYIQSTYAVAVQVLFSTYNEQLIDKYLINICTQLSQDDVNVQTEAKTKLLLFCIGKFDKIEKLGDQTNNEEKNDQKNDKNKKKDPKLLYQIITNLFKLLLNSTFTTQSYRNIDNVLDIIPLNIHLWELTPYQTADLLHMAYTYRVLTLSSPFSCRSLLALALKQISKFDNLDNDNEKELINNIITKLFTLIFTLPSHLICLDEFISYNNIANDGYIKSNNFINNYPLLSQLLTDFIQVNNFEQIENLTQSQNWLNLCKKYNLNNEFLRTNLISLTVSGYIQSGKGYRFETLKKLFSVDSIDLVEEYIVEATTHGQISTKINQLEGIVYVFRVIPREFTANTWVHIQKRLQHLDKVLTSAAAQHAK
jgi:hypothetical protein